jgi:hypothetical protein
MVHGHSTTTTPGCRDQANKLEGLAGVVAELVLLVRGDKDHVPGSERPIPLFALDDSRPLEHEHLVLIVMLMEWRAAPGVHLEMSHVKVRSAVVRPDEHAYPSALGTL